MPRTDGSQRRRQPGPELAHISTPGRQRRGTPEPAWRFVVIDTAIHMWQEPVAVLQHFTGYLGVARLIRVPEVVVAEARNEDKGSHQDQEYPVPPAHDEVMSTVSNCRR